MTTACVFAELARGDLRETIAAIRAIEGVKQAHLMMGPTDIIAFVETADLETLGEAVVAMRALDGVGRPDTRLAWPF